MLRATLTSLLARKLRLVLSGTAIVLGVMAVSGAFILSDHLTTAFSSMFQTRTASVDVQVTEDNVITQEGPPRSPPMPASMVRKVGDVPGVADAYGVINAEGAKVIGKDGKLATMRAPRYGEAWIGEKNQVELRSGRGPRAPNEVAIDANLAKQADFSVGDSIDILTLQPKRSFQVVGIFGYSGGRDTFMGEATVAFTQPVASELLLGQPNSYNSINVSAQDGVSAAELRDRISAELGDGYQVRTGEEVAEQSAAQINQFVNTVRAVLLGFAGVALFVGIFLILNTFSILIAQRTKELALFRSLGAGRGQLVGAVLIEALVIGAIASTLGLVAGLGIAKGLMALIEGNTGFVLPSLELALPATAVVSSYVVGLLVTVIAALVPALRASRVAPIAAMREAAVTDKPVTKLGLTGTALALTGAAAIAIALFTDVGDALMAILLVGVLAVFVGVAMVTPALSQPVISVMGRVFGRSMAAGLARRNAARNPRRTAITAAALMVGITLVTGVSVLAASFKTSISEMFTSDVRAELIIGGESSGPSAPTFNPDVLTKVRQLDGVTGAVALYSDRVHTQGKDVEATAVDVAALGNVLTLEKTAGTIDKLGSNEVLVDDKFADEHAVAVGESLPVTTERGGESTLRVAGIFAENDTLGTSIVLPEVVAQQFQTAQATMGYVMVDSGTNVSQVRDQVNDLLRDNPEVSAMDVDAFVQQQASQIDTFVILMFVLLALALIIAALGIVNTLTLSIVERTRELGLIRAVGMSRRQVVGMITVEAVLVAVFGTLLGLVVGTGLGSAIARALRDSGVTALTIPWSWLAGFAALAVVVGLVAAIAPAIKAARINVLRAISYE